MLAGTDVCKIRPRKRERERESHDGNVFREALNNISTPVRLINREECANFRHFVVYLRNVCEFSLSSSFKTFNFKIVLIKANMFVIENSQNYLSVSSP